jgi:signal-transduction protein with cAMP-binding, CBS, and nucleotidyltransferase domain
MKVGIKVSEAMTKNPVVINPDNLIIDCAKLMEEKHVGTLIIKYPENGMIAIVTEQDIVRKVVAKNLNSEVTKIKEIAESNLFTISEKEDIYDALVLMRDKNIRHLPVVSTGELIGLLTIKDILKIQPQLFELIVDKFELREEFSKPINENRKLEGECHICSNFSRLHYMGSEWICEECSELK